jgi:hypothetical protein
MRGDEHVAMQLYQSVAGTVLKYTAQTIVLLFAFGFADLVVLAGVPHPIPYRTRSLSPPAPMVLSLKTWESRSLPGLPSRTPWPFPLLISIRGRGLLSDLRSAPGRDARLSRSTVHLSGASTPCGPRSRFRGLLPEPVREQEYQ